MAIYLMDKRRSEREREREREGGERENENERWNNSVLTSESYPQKLRINEQRLIDLACTC